MIKKLYLLLLISLIFFTQANAQKSLPKNPEPGKCYVRCFDYDKIVKWEEIDCSLAKDSAKTFKRTKENVEKLKKYQQKLIDLGYKLSVTGYPDNRTINAHNRYLAKKVREERRRKRKEKRRLKKERKKNKVKK